MPWLESNDWHTANRALKRKRAKLIAKGLDPRSNKFNTLLYRRGR